MSLSTLRWIVLGLKEIVLHQSNTNAHHISVDCNAARGALTLRALSRVLRGAAGRGAAAVPLMGGPMWRHAESREAQEHQGARKLSKVSQITVTTAVHVYASMYVHVISSNYSTYEHNSFKESVWLPTLPTSMTCS